jgi:hypothetical protein
MSSINKPYTFTDNTAAEASEVNANFDTIYNDYNGGISATNLATGAVTTAKIADSNVTTTKIADANVTTPKLDTELQGLRFSYYYYSTLRRYYKIFCRR